MSFVLHVGVVGFHHQLGNQVEMLYPPVFLPSPPPALLPPFDRSPETSPTPSSSSSAIQRVESTPRGTTTTSSSSTSSSHALMRKTSTGQSIDRVFVPQLWQCLPFYALPDGAHGVEEDFVCVPGPRPHDPRIPIAIDTSLTPLSTLMSRYFTLPHLHRPKSTIYGIACYRYRTSCRRQSR